MAVSDRARGEHGVSGSQGQRVPGSSGGQSTEHLQLFVEQRVPLPHPQPLEELSVRALEWQHWSAPKLFHMSLLKYQPVLAVRYPSLQLS